MKNYNVILTAKQEEYPLSSGKIDQYEYLTCEEILPSDHSRMMKLILLFLL